MHIQITETEYDFLKIISSVFIGMFGKSIFDYFKILRENKKNRNFVIDYLKSAENVFPILTLEYNKLKEYINTDNNGNETGIIKIKLFEDFNTDILKSITFPNYYKLFNKKALLIYDIYHITNILKDALPYQMGKKYIEIEQNHYSKFHGNENKHKSFNNCENCKFQRKLLTENIDIKLNEVNILKEKVALFLKD
jgi:hypothetical protein